MSVKYVCKHCRSAMANFSGERVSELQLGLHFLTPEERKDIISYDSNGDMTVHLICDYCLEALEAHPELALIGNPLQ